MKEQNPKMLNSRICLYCHKVINKGADFATLVSHSNEKIVNQDNWHRQCFNLWLDKRIEDKLKVLIATGIDRVNSVMNNNGMVA
jgi:hypothetical protein